MKKIFSGVLILAVLIFSACSEIDKLKNEYIDNNDEKAMKAGTIKYNDDTVMGVTREEPIVNGGFQIYDLGTGDPVGFILVDGSVTNFGGEDIGVCQGAVISESGVDGECIVPVANPANVVVAPRADPTPPPAEIPVPPVDQTPPPVETPVPPAEPTPPPVETPAPPPSAVLGTTTIRTTSGEVMRVDKTANGFVFEGHEGEIVLLELYGPYCPHCTAAIPGYNRLQAKYPNDVYVVTLEVNGQYGGLNDAALKQFAAQNGMQYDTVATENTGNMFSFVQSLTGYTTNQGVPVLLILSRNGDLAKYLPPQDFPEAYVDNLIQSLL